MRQLEIAARQNANFVSWVFKEFSNNCQPCIPGKVWKYVLNNFRFVDDYPHDEFIAAPYALLEIKQGDCDDFACFIKTCLDILGGWNTHYILFAKEKNEFSHVAVFAHRGIAGNDYIDAVIIDGANNNFNLMPLKYKYYQIVE